MDAPDADPAGSESNFDRRRVHRKLYLRSAINTLLFYGTVLVVCLALPYFVAMGVAVFFLLFYKREIRAFLRSPLKRTRLRSSPADDKGEYRLTPFDPDAFDRDPPGHGG